MNMAKFALLGFIMFAFSSCAASDGEDNFGYEAAEVYLEEPPQAPQSIRLALEVSVEPAPLEPAQGVLTGIYLRQDQTVSGVSDFETQIGVEHSIFAYSIFLGEEYPLFFVLESIANRKIPMLTIHAPQEFDVNHIYKLAEDIGRFNVPILINFLPILGESSFSPTEYIGIFRHARQTFYKHAPNATLIWGIDTDNLFTAAHFFPGEGYVDWVSLTIYDDVDEYGNFGDFFKYIDFLNVSFQRMAPLMIITAVSHHNFATNTYFAIQARDRLWYIYGGLLAYPRIKAIVYQNYAYIDRQQNIGQNYIISGSSLVEEAYRIALNRPELEVYLPREPHTRRILINSLFTAIEYNGRFYVPHRTLVYDMNFPNMQQFLGREVFFGDQIYYSIADVNRIAGADFFVDRENAMFVLQIID